MSKQVKISRAGWLTGWPGSHIYQQEFAKLVAEMRLSHIDGFQPYDQFVRRLLGRNYDFINGLHQRHGRIQEQISSLGRQLRAAELGRQTSTIEEFQRTAELGFFLAPFEYYLSTVFTKLIDWTPIYKAHPKRWGVGLMVGSYIIGFGIYGRKILGPRFKTAAKEVWSRRHSGWEWSKRAPGRAWNQLKNSTTWPTP